MTYSCSGTRPTKVKRPLESVVTSFGKACAKGLDAGDRILIRQGHACPRPAGAVDQPTGDGAPRPEPGHERARLRVSDGQGPGEPSAFVMDRQISESDGRSGRLRERRRLPRLPPAFTDEIGRRRAADDCTGQRLSVGIEDPDDRLGPGDE